MNNCKILNVQIDDRLRYGGISKYSFNNRIWVNIINLIKVYILMKRKMETEQIWLIIDLLVKQFLHRAFLFNGL